MDELKDQLDALRNLVKKKKPEVKEEPKKEEIKKKDFADKPKGNKWAQKPLEKKQEIKDDFLKEKEAQPKTGLKQKLTGLYYSAEDKYYNLMDKLNEKIPVYKVIDPIDDIVPSFLLFAGIILILLILLVAFVLVPIVLPLDNAISLTIKLKKDDVDEILSDYVVFVSIDGNETELRTDDNAMIVLKNLKMDSLVQIEVVDVPNYEDYNKSIKITEKDNFILIKLKKKPGSSDKGWATKTVRFKELNGGSVNGFLRASFKCSESNEFIEVIGETSLTKSTTDGTIRIKVKEDKCGDVLVSVNSDNYEVVEDQVLPENNTIYLTKKQGSDGSIHITVLDETGELLNKTMKFSLFEENDASNPVIGVSNTIYSGSKDFDVVPGTYFITVFDADDSEEFSCENSSEAKELLADEEIFFEVTCFSISQQDAISIMVLDKVSRESVVSVIELRKKQDNKFELVSKKSGVSSVSFAIADEADYIVLVSAGNYLPYEGEKILKKGDSLIVELVKANEQTAGKALIKVFDAEGNSVSSGNVFLRYSEGNLINLRAPYSALVGFKGEALISGIKPGKYYAEALTNVQKGVSSAKSIDANKVTDFQVNMQKIRGLVELNVTKFNFSSELTGFDVVFFNAVNEKKVSDEDFVFVKKNVFAFDAGQYYAIISKDNYHTTKSKNFIVIEDSKTIVNIALPPLSGKEISIDFIGLFKENGLPVNSIELNKEYSAEFMLTVNPDSNVFYFNFLLGTGNNKLMQDDAVFISSFSSPFGQDSIVSKTTSFTGNYSTDFTSNSTQGNAKAILIEFDDFDRRDFVETAFVVPVKIKLKENLLDANSLVLFFKALSVGNSFDAPIYSLDPVDDKEFTSLESYVYSNHKTEVLNLCSHNFCYGYSLFSKSADSSCNVIKFGSVLSIKINCDYDLSSFVLNNKKDYDNIDFSLENSSSGSYPTPLDAIIFKDYLIKTKSVERTGTANDRIIEESFPLNKKELIFAQADFKALKLVKNTGKLPAIQTRLADGTLIDKNFLELRVRSDLNLNLTLDPNEIMPFIETSLLAELLDSQGNPIEEAEIKVESIDSVSGQTTIIGIEFTDNLGQVYFEGNKKIPALYPLTKVKVTAEYDDLIVSKSIDVNSANTYDFIPKSLFFSFFPSENEIKSKDLNFFDLSNGSLNQKITNAWFDFASNSDFFDENSLNNYHGMKFTSAGTITPVYLSLDTNQTADLNENVSVDATLNIEIEINGFTDSRTVPIAVAINNFSDYVRAYFPPNGNEVSETNKISVALFAGDGSAFTEFALKKKNIGSISVKITDVLIESDAVYLNISEMQSLIEAQEEHIIPANGLTVGFMVVMAAGAGTINEKATETGNIVFVFDVNGHQDFLSVPFKVEIIPAGDALSVTPDKLDYIFYLANSVNQTKTVNFRSSSDAFVLTLNNISFDLNSEFVSTQISNHSFSVNSAGQDIDFTFGLTNAGKALKASYSVQGKIIIDYSVEDKDLTKEIPVSVSIQTPPPVIESEYFDLEACLGEGSLQKTGQHYDVDFWIGCNIGEEITSSSGCSSEKPKIKLSWKFNDFPIDTQGIGLCSKPDQNYSNYTYCDATQFSMELVYRLLAFKDGDASKTGNFTFYVTLIADNYNSSFFEDFDYWAMNVNSLDTPSKYLKQEGEADYGLARKYFAEQKIYAEVFSGGSESKIQTPGWYKVKATVQPELLVLEFTLNKSSFKLEPETGSEDSAFYYIPFDGLVGLKDGEFDRQGYGSSYDISSPSNKFTLNESDTENIEIFSAFDTPLNGLNILHLKQFDNFNKLNSSLNKGTLMEVATDTASNYKTMNFYPSYATPILMKADLNRTGNALLYYSIADAQAEKQVIEAGNLIDWTGLGENCVDFSGTPITNKKYSDAKAVASDVSNVAEYENVFKIPHWPSASRTGKVFLHSVIFSPVNVPLSYFKIVPYSNANNYPYEEVKLYSKSKQSNSGTPLQNWIALEGISGSQLNSAPNHSVNSLQDLFDLIDSGYACVKNQGNYTYILWNQDKLLEEISSVEDALNIESQCISN